MRNNSVGEMKTLRAARVDRQRRLACAVAEAIEGRTLFSAGALDPSFGNGGKVLLPVTAGSAQLNVLADAVQSDGKVILVGGASTGSASTGGSTSFFLERLTAGGSLDASFGSGGFVMTDIPGAADAVAIQPDGKIVIGGPGTTSGAPDLGPLWLARFNANGTPDSTFGGRFDGSVLVTIPGQATLDAIALTPDGKIVEAGKGVAKDPVNNNAVEVVEAARYNANGSLDTSFNKSGYVLRQLDTLGYFYDTVSVAVQSNDQVLIGSAFKEDMAAWRYNADGSIDTQFGQGGMAVVPFSFGSFTTDDYSWGSISSMLVQPDGKILVAGPANFEDGSTITWELARFNTNGTLDRGFGNAGQVVVTGLGHVSASFSVPYVPGGIGLSNNGSIVIGGTDALGNLSNASGDYQGPFIVKRYTSNGAVDPNFQTQDINFFPTTDGSGGVTAVAPNGDVVIAGDAANQTNPGFDAAPTNIAVARVLGGTPGTASNPPPPAPTSTPGQIDPTFGNPSLTFGTQGGQLLNDPDPLSFPSSVQNSVKAVAVQPDGKIVVVGSTGTKANADIGQFFLERLNPDGSIDTTFGAGGVVHTGIGAYAFADAVLVQADGEILVGGASEDSAVAPKDAIFALARYKSNGSLDPTFGTGGIVTTDFAGNEQIDSLALAPGGGIVAVGSYFLYPNVGFDVARYLPDGRLDTSFNGSGKLQYSLGATGSNSSRSGLAVQGDGKIVVSSHSGSDLAVYRFNVGGSPDATFGNHGVATTGGAVHTAATSVLIQPDGKIVAGGIDPNYGIVLARFTAGGALDGSFGTPSQISTPGIAVASDLNTTGPLAAVLLQPDGKLLVVGNDRNFNADSSPKPVGEAVQRLLANGQPDLSFQAFNAPHFLPPPPWGNEVAEAAALGPDGKLVVASDISADQTATAPHFTGVARYITGVVPVPVSTPYLGHPFGVGVDRIEAENFDNGGQGVSYFDTTPGNHNGYYRNTDVDINKGSNDSNGYSVGYTAPGEWLAYTITTAQSGTYKLQASVACQGVGGTFHVEIDGFNVTGSLQVPNTGPWDTWRTVTSQTFTVSAGTHVMKVFMDRNGSAGCIGDFDYFNFVPVTGRTPFLGHPFNIATDTIEAENFDNGGQGVSYYDTTPGNHNGYYRNTDVDINKGSNDSNGYSVGYTAPGEWLDYTITVPTGGVYRFVARVASQGQGGTFHAEIDGGDATGALAVPNTGPWDTWQNVTSNPFSVSAGTHTLRVFMDKTGPSGAIGDFDYFKFVSA